MSRIFKQENAYGCGLYALANIFQDESIITQTRLIESKSGNNTGQLNKWLIEYGQELYLEPLFFNNTGKRLPKWICGMLPKGEGVISMPIMIDVQFIKNGKTHFIAAEIFTTGELYVMDSLKSEAYLTTLSELNKSFYRIFGVWYLRHYYEEGYFMRMK